MDRFCVVLRRFCPVVTRIKHDMRRLYASCGLSRDLPLHVVFVYTRCLFMVLCKSWCDSFDKHATPHWRQMRFIVHSIPTSLFANNYSCVSRNLVAADGARYYPRTKYRRRCARCHPFPFCARTRDAHAYIILYCTRDTYDASLYAMHPCRTSVRPQRTKLACTLHGDYHLYSATVAKQKKPTRNKNAEG